MTSGAGSHLTCDTSQPINSTLPSVPHRFSSLRRNLARETERTKIDKFCLTIAVHLSYRRGNISLTGECAMRAHPPRSSVLLRPDPPRAAPSCPHGGPLPVQERNWPGPCQKRSSAPSPLASRLAKTARSPASRPRPAATDCHVDPADARTGRPRKSMRHLRWALKRPKRRMRSAVSPGSPKRPRAARSSASTRSPIPMATSSARSPTAGQLDRRRLDPGALGSGDLGPQGSPQLSRRQPADQGQGHRARGRVRLRPGGTDRRGPGERSRAL
jgi:hypothetical protein